jgi:hypothetical protein
MNLAGVVTTVAHAVSAGTFGGGTELKLPVDQMWLLKCGGNGDHNAKLVSPDQWAAFQKIWADIASGRIDAGATIAPQ